MPRLGPALLPSLQVRQPGYDRDALAEGVVHLGLGAFHRAHQAVYFDELARQGDLRWGIVGVSLRSAAVRDALAPQDGLYTVVQHGAGDHPGPTVIAMLKRLLVAPEDPAAVVAAMAQPSVHLVTLTVTEKGYGIDRATGELDRANADVAADLASLAAPRSAAGFIVAALATRRARGLPAFAAMSCDNLPHNGALLRTAVLAMARAHDPALADWIAADVPFPATMVDRIVPATTPGQIKQFAKDYHFRDLDLVETEAFSQWVIGSYSSLERPDFEAAGAAFVDDVAPWEEAKLRLLNGAHSMIAYLGGLAGIAHVHEFVADPARRALVERLWDESETTLAPVPGLDFAPYRQELMARFANPQLRHAARQIAMDGSQKLPQRLVAPLRALLAAGQNAPALELAIAGWMAWQRGEDANGNRFTVDDPLAERTAAIWSRAADVEAAAQALLALPEIFGSLATDFPEAGARIATILQSLINKGPSALIADRAGEPITP